MLQQIQPKTAPENLQVKYDLLRSYETLAETQLQNGNVVNANENAFNALKLVRRVSDANPKNTYHQDSYAFSLKVMAKIRQTQNQPEEAINLTGEAV